MGIFEKFYSAQGRRMLSLALAFLLLLSACGSRARESSDNGVVRLTYAAVGAEAAGRAQALAKSFNIRHQDIKVEVQEYIGENGRSAKDLLITEILAGNIPDIFDLGDGLPGGDCLPYPLLVQKGYLEDLWPYIEKDPDLGREGVVEALLKAAEVDGGLYAAFGSALICTAIGAESLIGSRKSWTLADIREIFDSMPDGSTVLPYSAVRDTTFKVMLTYSLEGYVDRTASTCSFDSDEFRSALDFVREFPESFDMEAAGGFMTVALERADRYLHGYQMLEYWTISHPVDIQEIDNSFGLGGKAVCIGYPTESGLSGNWFRSLQTLGMSSACRNKEAAWVFIRELFLPQYENMDALRKLDHITLSEHGVPVNRSDYDLLKKAAANGTLSRIMSTTVGGPYGFPGTNYRKATQEEIARFDELVNDTRTISLYDQALYNIVYEAAGPYFAGHKTMEETIALVENRVKLYLNEQK